VRTPEIKRTAPARTPATRTHSELLALGGSVLGGLLALSLPAQAQEAAPGKPGDSLQLRMQRELGYLGAPPAGSTPTFIYAEEISGNPEEKVTLKRDAEIRRNGNVIRADNLVYDVREDSVSAFGNARILKPGVLISGPSLKAKATTGEGEIEKPRFFLENIGGIGQADKAEFNGIDRLKLFGTRYTTCQVEDIGKADWYVEAGQLDLDMTEEEGKAQNGRVRFKGVQLLKASSLGFPLKNQRKTGFLPPTLSFTTRSGVEVTSPFYLDIAPNRDLTIIPRAYATRGLQLGANFRYLEADGSGELKFERMENDRQTGTLRYSMLGRGSQNFGGGLVGGYNFAKVSDDRYFVDFSRTLVGASQRNLPQDAFVSLLRDDYNLTTRFTRFQTLQDPMNPTTVPYNRTPQVLFNAQKLDAGGYDLNLTTEAARFSHPTLVDGTRLVARPSLSYPVMGAAYSITPRISIQSVAYQLNALPGSNLPSNSLTSSVPIASLDGRLFFEKDTRLRGADLIQTLEPRMFLLYAPNRDQSSQPLFDTNVADFNYTQIFSENRFAGFDRVGDARQITLAATSRFLDKKDGSERFRLFAGQRFNLSDQQVTIPGQPSRTDSRTDFLLGAGGQVNRELSVEALSQISADTGLINRGNVTLRLRPGENKTINAAYRYTRDALSQVDFSGQYPLGGRWYGVGRINYSFRESRYIETIAGFEYDGGCWVSRLVTQSFASATGVKTSTILAQLELNGFSKIGSEPMKLLRRAVPGYTPLNNSGYFNPQAEMKDSLSDYQ
jgi:LPS-assembly protein